MKHAIVVGASWKLFHLVRVIGMKALGEADGLPTYGQQQRLVRRRITLYHYLDGFKIFP